MIGLVLIAIGCTVGAILALRNIFRRSRFVVILIGAPLGYYLIFRMPAGGADNPLSILIGGWCLAGTLGALLLELATLFGPRKSAGRD
ncbi:MAG TPA: hypothetical protein VIT38_02915 [Allosphingosinicella sp.]